MNTPSLQKLALCAAIALAPAMIVTAQTAADTPNPTPAPAAAPMEDETLVLSPFTVSTAKDVGYLAGNTLAGSRLNTKLKDTGAAISVFTPEFIKDIGATNMKDLILFENNAVPDVGDAAISVNGNPMVGNDEWQLRIRGLAASYSRNFFKWETSSDFYNVDRIDQTRGPNGILFGFGAPGGLVNTSTKQAMVDVNKSEVSYTAGSWNRNRGTLDTNLALVPNKLALRVNAMAENGKSWRDYEFDRARRAHLAAKWTPSKDTSFRVEGEFGKVNDNVARPWLAIDQSFLWRNGGRQTATAGSWPPPTGGTFLWSGTNHMVVGDDGVVRNWVTHAIGSNNADSNKSATYQSAGSNGLGAADEAWAAPTWSAWTNNSIIPRTANTGGPDATRETKYKTVSAFFESKVGDKLSYELALNHQSSDFLGYDPDGSRATSFYGNSTEIWGDASADLPSAGLNSWGASDGTNPNAGKLYLENNWTRRTQHIKATDLRGTVAYSFNTGDWAKHRLAGLLGYGDRKFKRIEEAEAFADLSAWPYDATTAEADINRVYRRHYFTEGDAKDIHVQSWRVNVPGTRWVATQQPEDTDAKQTTGMVALQSFFFKDKLVTILGFREDSLKYNYNYPLIPTRSNGVIVLDPSKATSHTFDPNTLTAGAVYHLTQWLSFYGNVSSSRDLPDLRIHLIGSTISPMPESKGVDAGIKLDLLDGKLYATIGYYKGTTKHSTDFGTVQTDITDRNTKILTALRRDNLITAADYDSHLINANGFMEDRDTSGWELGLVANPTNNWRVSANFSINHLVAHNSMAEVKAWADKNVAWWRQQVVAGGYTAANYPLTTGTDWDYLNANVGWMNSGIDSITALDGHEARGQRQYGANLYNKYTFESGAFKGFSIGGGGRYQSKNVLGMYDDTLDAKYNPTVHYGRSLVLLDANLGYSFKTEWAGKESWMELQLNVSNLFNKQDDQIYTLAWWGTVSSDGKTLTRSAERIGLQEPRKYTLSATLHF
jgi:outer membrane receptor protein involved in Fe transport